VIGGVVATRVVTVVYPEPVAITQATTRSPSSWPGLVLPGRGLLPLDGGHTEKSRRDPRSSLPAATHLGLDHPVDRVAFLIIGVINQCH
jgi:hypothetical protein